MRDRAVAELAARSREKRRRTAIRYMIGVTGLTVGLAGTIGAIYAAYSLAHRRGAVWIAVLAGSLIWQAAVIALTCLLAARVNRRPEQAEQSALEAYRVLTGASLSGTLFLYPFVFGDEEPPGDAETRRQSAAEMIYMFGMMLFALLSIRLVPGSSVASSMSSWFLCMIPFGFLTLKLIKPTVGKKTRRGRALAILIAATLNLSVLSLYMVYETKVDEAKVALPEDGYVAARVDYDVRLRGETGGSTPDSAGIAINGMDVEDGIVAEIPMNRALTFEGGTTFAIGPRSYMLYGYTDAVLTPELVGDGYRLEIPLRMQDGVSGTIDVKIARDLPFWEVVLR